MYIAAIGFILSETKSMENLARYIKRASFWQGEDELYKGAVKSYI